MLRVTKSASREVEKIGTDGKTTKVKVPFTYETFIPLAGELGRKPSEDAAAYGDRIAGIIDSVNKAAAEAECKDRTEYVNREVDGTYVAVLQADKPTDTVVLSGFEAALSNGLNLLFNAPAAAGVVPKKRGKDELRREAVAAFVKADPAKNGPVVVQWMVAGTFNAEADKLVAQQTTTAAK